MTTLHTIHAKALAIHDNDDLDMFIRWTRVVLLDSQGSSRRRGPCPRPCYFPSLDIEFIGTSQGPGRRMKTVARIRSTGEPVASLDLRTLADIDYHGAWMNDIDRTEAQGRAWLKQHYQGVPEVRDGKVRYLPLSPQLL